MKAGGPCMPALRFALNASVTLGREENGFLVLTDGVLEELDRGETQALLACDTTRLRWGDAAIWSAYARLSLAPTSSRLVGKRGPPSAFFFGNIVLLAALWLGLLLEADSPGWSRAFLVLGMPSLMMVTTLLVNLLASLPLAGCSGWTRASGFWQLTVKQHPSPVGRRPWPRPTRWRKLARAARPRLRRQRLDRTDQTAQVPTSWTRSLVPGEGMEPPTEPGGEAEGTWRPGKIKALTAEPPGLASVAGLAGLQPMVLPMISRITSRVPPPMGPRRMSRKVRETGYSSMKP